jgi:tetratricopeptide (TPR) repeat protein
MKGGSDEKAGPLNRRGWPQASPSDPANEFLRRALDDAALRGPDDVTLRRGWAAVAEPVKAPRSRSWSWFAGGVATTAVMAVVCGLWLWPRAVARFGLASPAAPAATPVALGTRRLTLEGGVEAQLGSSSVMRIEDGAPRVDQGEVRFSVPHRPPGHPFIVRADDYSVVVVGTRFGVSVRGQAVAVDVDEGVVEVRQTATQHRVARLTPGQAWQSADVSDVSIEMGAVPPSAPLTPPLPATPAVTVPAATPASGQVHVHSHDQRHAARSTARALALATPGEGIASTAGRASTGASSGLATANDEASGAARSALSAGDAPRALQIYRALALKTGPAAENAAYEVGKVLNERLGQPDGAVAAWRRYRADYPDGILRVEADVSIIETLVRTGASDEALGEANDFLRRRPDSERRAEIARLAGDLYRARGDCRRAVGAYQIVLGASRPRDIVEIANFHRAACLVRLGDSGGSEAVRAYLRAYPTGRFRSEAAALVADGARSVDGRARAQ